jgi:hypothetical protein
MTFAAECDGIRSYSSCAPIEQCLGRFCFRYFDSDSKCQKSVSCYGWQFTAQHVVVRGRDLIETAAAGHRLYIPGLFVLRFQFDTVHTSCDNSNKTRSLFVLLFCCTLTQGNNTSTDTVRAALSPSLSTHLSQGQRTTIHNIHINIVCMCIGGKGVQHADESRWNVCLIHAIVVTVFNLTIASVHTYLALFSWNVEK